MYRKKEKNRYTVLSQTSLEMLRKRFNGIIRIKLNIKINLSSNINLSPDSKNELKAHLGNNVTF